MQLLDRRHWVFDMDGTLTVPVHDFDAMRRELGLPPGVPLLEAIATRPAAEAGPMLARIDSWERELAAGATPQADARALLDALVERGHVLGIVTRNRRDTALVTLEACGMAHYFDADAVLGRETGRPKPAPDAIQVLLQGWRADPSDAVMVGDYVFDARAGRAAGTATVLVERHGPTDWDHEADRVVQTLADLLE